MADYPKYTILDSSDVTPIDGYEQRRASNGDLKVRKLSTGEKREFTIDHYLTKAERDTYEAFFQANKLLNVTLYWPGEASPATVRFVAAPKYSGPSGMRIYLVRTRLAEI
jgi:hypothetical protein